MKNTPKLPRIFLDTSALLSGLNSPSGASGLIISLFKLGKVILIISPEVILEVERNIENKFPHLKIPFLDLISHHPSTTLQITPEELAYSFQLLPTEDAPIVAGGIKAKADYLITLDKKFKNQARDKVKLIILLPGEFVQKYRKST